MDSEAPSPCSAADIKFIQGFEDSLRRDIASGRDYGGLHKSLQDRLKSLRDDNIQEPRWGSVVCVPDKTLPTKNQSVVRISGPFPGDEFEVMMDSAQKVSEFARYVSALNVACKKVEEIRSRAVAVIGKRLELEKEQKGLSQSAETTVDDHIRLLRQYNKTKDVGQQLIGLIAESRGVPLGTVYQDGEYGVYADD